MHELEKRAELSHPDQLFFNPEMTSTVQERDGTEPVVISAENIAQYSETTGEYNRQGSVRAFYIIYRAVTQAGYEIAGSAVQDVNYDPHTRGTHLGIKVNGLPSIIELIVNDELTPKLTGKSKQNFLDFCEELFTVAN